MSTLRGPSLFDEPPRLPAKIGSSLVGPSTIQTLLTPGRGSTSSFDYTLNAYRGCTFGCAYCYAPNFEARTDLAAKWGEWVEVKENALAALVGVDLRVKSIFMSSVTDPYQPVEAKLGLTRQIVARLLEQQAHLVVQTRSPIVARDADLLKQFRRCRVNLSIPTDSDDVRRAYEPRAPSIEARLQTVKKLKEHGITVSICISPMIPLRDPAEFAQRINDSGADRVTASWFHESTKPFTASTRALAITVNKVQGWNESDYRRCREILEQRCTSWTTSSRAFGPPGR